MHVTLNHMHDFKRNGTTGFRSSSQIQHTSNEVNFHHIRSYQKCLHFHETVFLAQTSLQTNHKSHLLAFRFAKVVTYYSQLYPQEYNHKLGTVYGLGTPFRGSTDGCVIWP